MNSKFNSKVLLLFAATLLIRIVTVLYIGKIPCMDPQYYRQAYGLFNLKGKIDLFITPSYGILLYIAQSLLKSPFLASAILYILFSFGSSVMSYLLASKLFNQKTGEVLLVLGLFLPNFTTAVAGYSHTTTVSAFFILTALYILVSFLKGHGSPFVYGFLFGLISLAAAFIRPESLAILVVLSLAMFVYKTRTIHKKFVFLLLSWAIIGIGLAGHGAFIKNRCNSPYPSTFSDARYSYRTYMATFSDARHKYKYYENSLVLKCDTCAEDTVALALSTQAFGSAQANHYSVFSAMLHNPKVTLINDFYNAKKSFDYFAHPLFCPFYIYFFLGMGLFALIREKNRQTLIFILSLFLISFIPIIFARAEIRYMMNCLYPVLFLAAYGITGLQTKKEQNMSMLGLSIFNFMFFLIYLVNNHLLSSLCS
jgi:4-amino-4-deoxy-L-arabinose transferase-like glycosyltransferase